MAIVNISAQHFTTNGKDMVLGMKGIVLVFFRMPDEKCKQAMAYFGHLSTSKPDVTCATIDVSSNSQVVRLSRATSTPIGQPPFFILYINGLPRAKLSSLQNSASLEQFVSKVIATLNSRAQPQQSFMARPTTQQSAPSQKVYNPEIGASPIALKSSSHYPQDDDDEDLLLVPPNITPKNVPWLNEI